MCQDGTTLHVSAAQSEPTGRGNHTVTSRSQSMANGQKRIRRTPEQLIAELEARIAQVKRRAETQKVKKDPALRHITLAVRSMDKAMAATQDAATRTAVAEARTVLTAVLSLNGVVVSGGSKARGASVNGGVKPDAERVARYISEHPGSRAEDIAAALGTGTMQLRPALMKLKAQGAVEPKGKARATRYY